MGVAGEVKGTQEAWSEITTLTARGTSLLVSL